MSGHSKWSTIKHKKGAADAKRAKIFTKLQKEILVSAKMGDPNPEFNPRLRNAVIAARSENMPKDRIEAAIKRATASNEGDNFEELRYEGHGVNGVAVIVETLTDNKNRTASNVRSAFTKSGGVLGETGSVSFMFDKVGIIGYEGSKIDEDKMFELCIECGAENVESDKEWHEITTEPKDFASVRDALIEKLGDPNESKITWKPKNMLIVDDFEKAEKIMKLIDKLEDDDDVQNVIINCEFTDEINERLANEE